MHALRLFVLMAVPALMIGVVAGVITFYGVELMEKVRIDDPVGAFPVHGMNGIFGVLAVAIWGVDGLGLLHGGGFAQLGIQIVGLLAATLWTLPLSFLIFYILKRTIGLRVSEEVEISGLDLPFHGIESYPEFDSIDGLAPQKNLGGMGIPIPAPSGD